jgi:hypothetical protein
VLVVGKKKKRKTKKPSIDLHPPIGEKKKEKKKRSMEREPMTRKQLFHISYRQAYEQIAVVQKC